jgi:hypothetical protein
MDNADVCFFFLLTKCTTLFLDEKVINPALMQRRELVAICIPASNIITNFIDAIDNEPLETSVSVCKYIPLLKGYI